jgi:hypothetical protein
MLVRVCGPHEGTQLQYVRQFATTGFLFLHLAI